MSATQLFALGMLARNGPMHGHQIRRQAELERAEFWGKVKVSSLYAALHGMEDDGLIEAVEQTQSGRFPARTVYAITPEGWRELIVLRDACFRDTSIDPDPLDLALSFSDDVDEQYLRVVIEERLASLRTLVESMDRQEQQVRQYLTPLNLAVFSHYKLRVAAEVRWHQEFLEQLPNVLAKPDQTAEADGRVAPIRRKRDE